LFQENETWDTKSPKKVPKTVWGGDGGFGEGKRREWGGKNKIGGGNTDRDYQKKKKQKKGTASHRLGLRRSI